MSLRSQSFEDRQERRNWEMVDTFTDIVWERAHEYDRYATDTTLLRELGTAVVQFDRAFSISTEKGAELARLLDDRYEELYATGFVKGAGAKRLVVHKSERYPYPLTQRELHTESPETAKLHAVQRYWLKHYFFPRVEETTPDRYHEWLVQYAADRPLIKDRFVPRMKIYRVLGDLTMVPLTQLEPFKNETYNHFLRVDLLVPPHVEVVSKDSTSVVYSWANMDVQTGLGKVLLAELPSTREFLKNNNVRGFTPVDAMNDMELRLRSAHRDMLDS